MSNTVLAVKDLTKVYPSSQKPVLDKISLSINKGEVVVVLGPSGCGKSTLLRAIVGLEDIQGGEVLLHDQVISGQKRESAAAGIGMVFQSYDLFPNMTVLKNVTLAPLVVQKRSEDEVLGTGRRTAASCGTVGEERLLPISSSGGQKQRVALARAVMRKPEMLLLDEPLSALDNAMREKLQDYLLALHDEFKMSVILVSHDIAEIYKLCSKVFVLENGKISRSGSASEIFLKKCRIAEICI